MPAIEEEKKEQLIGLPQPDLENQLRFHPPQLLDK